jgi:hypothetical protein
VVTVSVCKLDPTFGEQIRYLVTKFDILVFLAIASLIMKKIDCAVDIFHCLKLVDASFWHLETSCDFRSYATVMLISLVTGL